MSCFFVKIYFEFRVELMKWFFDRNRGDSKPSNLTLLGYVINNNLNFLYRIHRFCFAEVRNDRSMDLNNPGPIEIDWINYNYEKNGENHNTDKYYCMNQEHSTLVVRRGLPISFLLKFSRKFNKKKDRISFVFKFTGNNQ